MTYKTSKNILSNRSKTTVSSFTHKNSFKNLKYNAIAALISFNFSAAACDAYSANYIPDSITLAKAEKLRTVDMQFDQVRPLSEINSKKGDAYPWISHDGLRLYYCQESEKLDYIVMSQRKDVDADFEKPVKLGINSTQHDNISVWLSKDELSIYFFTRQSHGAFSSTLQKATRSSIGDSFGTSSTINLLGEASGFLSSPSFTNDMEELYLYNSPYGENRILVFEKIDELNYQLKHKVPTPKGHKILPGKLGSNGLKYYLPLENYATMENKICVFERSSIEEPFELCSEISNDLINEIKDSGQPSISNDGNFMVFTRSQGTWSQNDLYIAQKAVTPTPIVNSTKNNHINFSIYPNPAIDNLNIKLNSELQSTPLTISSYSMDGVLVSSKVYHANNGEISLSTQGHSSGMYLLIVNGDNLLKVSKRFVVKK